MPERPYFADVELQAESDRRWQERLRVFRKAFSWVDPEIKSSLAKLPTDAKFGPGEDDNNRAFLAAIKRYEWPQEGDAEVSAIHDRQNKDWQGLTPRPPLRNIKDWVDVAVLAGIPRHEFASHELRTIADAIIDWARRKLDGDSPIGNHPILSPNEFEALRIIGKSPVRLTAAALEVEHGLPSRKYLKPILKSLRKLNFIENSMGDRQGDAITSNGQEFLARHK